LKFRLEHLENGVILGIMKYSLQSQAGILFSAAILLSASASLVAAQTPKEKAKTPAVAKTSSKPAAKPAGKTAPKPAAVDPKLKQHLAANMKFFGVLSRYAQTLSSAKDPATARQAATKLETITKDAVTAGEELVKLGKPDPEIEMKLSSDADLKMTSQTVAEQTRAAVQSLASNAEVKTILAPAVENFQAALNRVQEAADEPRGLAESTPPGGKPAPAVAPPPAETPSTSSAEATQVPAPPP
jgi:hypothetical protein